MNDILLKLYHHLPSPARSLAATFRGLYLRSWRYGPATDDLVAEALERESWSRSQWEAYQEENLAHVLHRAVTRVPYYRNMWAKRRQKGDQRSWAYLENWPILEKDVLRAAPEAFVADDCNIRRMFPEHTSGTTGKPLTLWWSRQTVVDWYALFEARWRHWNGVSRSDRWAILGGQLVTPIEQRRPPFWVWNAALKQLYMSSYHLAPDLIPSYLDALARHQITYLWGYTSALYELALGALRQQERELQMQVVVTNAEPVFDYQREVIEEAFNCPLRETYGMAEAVAAAAECNHGKLHLWPEVGWVEVLKNGDVMECGEVGDLICTGLLNADMPLIRYRVGDRGALAARDADCQCGRTLPQLKQVEGRSDDVVYTKDGRRIGRLDPIFKAKLPIIEAQIIQEALDHFRVVYVPGDGFEERTKTALVTLLQDRLGSVEVTLEETERIPRTANGKFRAVICQLSQSELEMVNF